MKGSEVFRRAVGTLDSMARETLANHGFDKHDVSWLIPHQANLRIIGAAAKKLDLPMERVVVTVDEHANTSSASIPLALDVAVRDGRIKRGDLLLFEAFGAGFTWGSALVRYDPDGGRAPQRLNIAREFPPVSALTANSASPHPVPVDSRRWYCRFPDLYPASDGRVAETDLRTRRKPLINKASPLKSKV